ncbi:MarR family winged helix-turn-helix transcriptional regulator [Allorhizocola rhizosphaerae]|uniref:MarR family winged helix-turn-helix transcriptional regulator n=1 Tax=Allorhizocola rhizosphaerae TaxID=1872709 RepID=UPI000E3BEE4B|nr:MarR family winged helix-turn-helix transcriptional regulator [Allorhizocola rhizosphaerae]
MDGKSLSQQELAAWVRLATVLELLPGVLDSQLRSDAGLTHFQYIVLSTLSEAPQHTMRMTALAARTHATLPRLSHVAQRLQDLNLVERFPCPDDARATNIRLTAAGLQKVHDSAPGHSATVRHHVIDALTAEQVHQLTDIATAVLRRLGPHGATAASYTRYDLPATPPG